MRMKQLDRKPGFQLDAFREPGMDPFGLRKEFLLQRRLEVRRVRGKGAQRLKYLPQREEGRVGNILRPLGRECGAKLKIEGDASICAIVAADDAGYAPLAD